MVCVKCILGSHMGIKRTTCESCEFLKLSKKEQCKFPKEWGKKMSSCSGWQIYYPLWKEARDFVLKNYKGFR